MTEYEMKSLALLEQIAANTNKAARPASAAPADGSPVFPPFGRSNGMPVFGASAQDLEFYANACRRSIADPSKSRFHAKERALLGAIEAELQRAYGITSSAQASPPPPDDSIPPPNDNDAPF